MAAGLALIAALAMAQGRSRTMRLDQLTDEKAPAMGPEDAPAVVVEFSDFQCPYCKRMDEMIKKWREESPGKIRVIFMDRPLVESYDDGYPFHPYAVLAHEAAAQANEEGKFWEMKDWIFKNRLHLFPRGRPVSDADYKAKLDDLSGKLVAGAAKLGLDPKKMHKALSERTHRDLIETRAKKAMRLAINSAPTVFVNGRRIGSDPAKIKAAIEAAIK